MEYDENKSANEKDEKPQKNIIDDSWWWWTRYLGVFEWEGKKNEKRVVDYFDWNARKVFPSTVDFISIKTERNKQSHRSPSERMPTRISHLIARIHAVCSSPPPPCAYHNLCFLAVVSQTDRGDDDENLIIPAARVSHTETGPTTTTARRGWIIKASENGMKLMIISRSLDCKESAIRPRKRALLFVLLTSSLAGWLGVGKDRLINIA